MNPSRRKPALPPRPPPASQPHPGPVLLLGFRAGFLVGAAMGGVLVRLGGFRFGAPAAGVGAGIPLGTMAVRLIPVRLAKARFCAERGEDARFTFFGGPPQMPRRGFLHSMGPVHS